ncbi:MAG: hypothetical protein C0404_12355 [Verrucomicrobia bacterium]|nr:hypothetical protein [Verrucomicrobiota bacterium]
MTETDKYILDAIRKWVWSGFYSSDEVDSMIDDLLENDANERMLRASVVPEFAKKREAEKTWPSITDCDRLGTVFAALEKRGILCLQNTGYTMSDGHEDACEALSGHPKGKYFGYTFYHGQDVERAVDGGGLTLAFDHVDGDVPDKLKVGLSVKEELEREGFVLNWNGTVDQRISIPHFDWKRRNSDD